MSDFLRAVFPNSFSTPLLAQTWFEFRSRLVTVLLIASGGVGFGLLRQHFPTEPFGHGPILSAATILLAIFVWDEYLNELAPKRNSAFGHLPLTAPIRAAAEALVLGGSLAVASLIYWVVGDLVPNGLSASWPIPVVVGPALGLVALIWSKSLHRAGVAGRLLLIGLFVLTFWILIDLGESGAGAVAPTAILVALASGAASLAMLLYLPWSDLEAKVSANQTYASVQRCEHPSAGPDSRKFGSPLLAQSWYERRAFLRVLGGSEHFYSGVPPLAAMMVWLPIEITGSPFELVHVGLFLSIVLCLQRFDIVRTGFEFGLPQSDWRISLAQLRFFAAALVLVLGASTLVGLCVTSRYDAASVGFATDALVKATLVGWSTLALAPGFICGMLVSLACGLSDSKQILPLLTCAECFAIALFVLFPRTSGGRHSSLSLISVMVCLGAIFAAQLLLPYPGEATRTHRAVYEILGALLVLSLLIDQYLLGSIPATAARTLFTLLLVGTAFALLFCPNPAYTQLAPAGFGYFPPLLLPFLLTPRFVLLARRMPKWNSTWRSTAF